MKKIKPILFNQEMIRAILAGRKTQTRRIMKPQPVGIFENQKEFPLIKYKPGMTLWVRETWQKTSGANKYLYKADPYMETVKKYQTWRPSIFMPKEACRLFLEVQAVRAERLQDISFEDCRAEGLKNDIVNKNFNNGKLLADWIQLWNSINGRRGFPWSSNCWVWVITFKIHDRFKIK